MNAEQKIRTAIEAKNWNVESYDYERPFGHDREGGYDISIDLDNYSERETDETDRLYDVYFDALEAAGKALMKTKTSDTVVIQSGSIMGYKLADILIAISLIPDRLTLN